MKLKKKDYLAYLDERVPLGYEIRFQFRDTDGRVRLVRFAADDREGAARWMKKMNRRFGWVYSPGPLRPWKRRRFFLARLP